MVSAPSRARCGLVEGAVPTTRPRAGPGWRTPLGGKAGAADNPTSVASLAPVPSRLLLHVVALCHTWWCVAGEGDIGDISGNHGGVHVGAGTRADQHAGGA